MSLKVPSRGSDQFNLRFPEGMRDRIASEAEKNGRSMNAEIILRLEVSLGDVVGFDEGSSIDHALGYYLRRLQGGPYVPGQAEEVSELVTKVKEMETEAMRTLVDGALRLLQRAEQYDEDTVNAAGRWGWDSQPKDE